MRVYNLILIYFNLTFYCTILQHEIDMKRLKEQWTDLSPKVNDVNDISSEMNAGVIYEIYLLNSRNFGQKLGGSHVRK